MLWQLPLCHSCFVANAFIVVVVVVVVIAIAIAASTYVCPHQIVKIKAMFVSNVNIVVAVV